MLCINKTKEKSVSIKTKPSQSICQHNYFKNKGECYGFVRIENGSSFKDMHHKMSLSWNSLNNFAYLFKYLFDAVKVILPPIFTKDLKYYKTYKRYDNIYDFQYKKTRSNKKIDGFVIYKSKIYEMNLGGNLYKCSIEGPYISYHYVCDGHEDCPGDVPDESSCKCSETEYHSIKYKYIKIINKRKKYTALFSRAHDYNLQTNMSITGITTREKITMSSVCTKNGELPCEINSFSCFYIYKINRSRNLIPCEYGEHLQKCSQFECNKMFKCPEYYCIPWSYVCDNKWDCPGGYDESEGHSCGINRTCNNMLKCRKSQTCIHLAETCDNVTDCTLGDDAFFSTFHEQLCTALCQCSLFAIQCLNISISYNNLQKLFYYHANFIHHCIFSTADKLCYYQSLLMV